MSKKRIVIKNGEVCGFADEVSFKGLDVQGYSKKGFLASCQRMAF